MKAHAHTIRPGDVIMPPERELRLWMRRRAAEQGLPEEALYLEVVEVYEGAPDKRGPWIWIRALSSPKWPSRTPWKIKARPDTDWTIVQRAPSSPARPG